jgi:hypothetical protein
MADGHKVSRDPGSEVEDISELALDSVLGRP